MIEKISKFFFLIGSLGMIILTLVELSNGNVSGAINNVELAAIGFICWMVV